MRKGLIKAVGSTRLWRVQFGVPPNCGGVDATILGLSNGWSVYSAQVSGATPETTRVTRVLPTYSNGGLLTG
jgi:hypothetical protein